MTLRERVIVEVYTGYCMTSPQERDEVYKYMAEIMGRPVFTHELADKAIQERLREKSLEDFKKLCIPNELEEQPRGVLNRHIYDNGCFTDKEVELFEKIEKALGYKLFKWQKTYLVVGAFRQYGKTTAKILRDLLAVKEPPLDLSTPKNPREDIYRDDCRKIQERLTAAGIPTRTVFYSKGQKAHYGKTIRAAFIDDIHNRQQS